MLSHQLDGEWIARLHGVPGVFRADRIKTTLKTIKRLNAPLTTAGLLVVVGSDGKPTTFGGRIGGLSSMPTSVFITAMNYLYEGDMESGLKIAHDCLHEMVCEQGMTWDVPNILIGTKERKQRVCGTDYYQSMSLWAIPAAMAGNDLSEPCKPGGLVYEIINVGAKL